MLNVILIEDSENDALLITDALETGGLEVLIHRVDTSPDLSAALSSGTPWDLIISDHALTQFDGFEAFSICREFEANIPFIMVSGYISESKATLAHERGINALVSKNALSQLVPVINHLLWEAKLQRARKT